MTDTRLIQLQEWLNTEYKTHLILTAITNDASFRQYYRFTHNSQSFLAVDSPPSKENNESYLSVNKLLATHGVNVPKIYAQNLQLGFLVIEDFGNDVLLSKLKEDNAPEELYSACLDQLLKIQQCNQQSIMNSEYNLPNYDASLLMREMDLFREWFLGSYLKFSLSSLEQSMLDKTFNVLITAAQSQPIVLVHRDFHSRNLICLKNNQVGVIDFQDAVWGPVTYDLISLYRDCYIAWPIVKVQEWTLDYFNRCKSNNIISIHTTFEQYWLWFLQMTLQRNFKTIGIFARLCLRDNKPVYLGDIPRTLNYAFEVSALLAKISPENKDLFAELNTFIAEWIIPEVRTLNSSNSFNGDKVIT